VIGLAAPCRGQLNEQPDVVVSAAILNTGNQPALQITAKIRDGLHIYAQSQPRPFLATRIAISETPGIELTGPFTADQEPIRLRHEQLDVELHEFENTVVWTAPLKLEGTSAATTLQGTVFAQACEEGRCFAPVTYTFEVKTGNTPASPVAIPAIALPSLPNEPAVTTAPAATTAPVIPRPNNPEPQTAETEFRLETLELSSTRKTRSVWVVLPLSFLAGFLLNFMPCVLPVVGLKLLSFVQQAQSDRRRILLMNLSYTAGLLSVMLVLASLAVFAGLGWGEQFSSSGFTITLSVIVFAFGLSFLGVWDIPLPGFVSTADGNAPQEGYAGAFSKGILSTLLATPCSGPFLGAALAWAVTQPSILTYAVFVTVGLGMASPYLVVGAMPSLIRFLPKPGNWMVTFKYVMGFVMLGTVVYLLSFVSIASVVPTVLLLLGVGIAVWYAGRTPLTAATPEKLRAWGIALGIVLMTTSLSFGRLENIMQERFERAAERFVAERFDLNSPKETAVQEGIAWQDYSAERLETAIASGRPVFIDFTADWCLTCKANEATAVNTQQMIEAIQNNNAIALRADKTAPNPAADELLRKLGNSAASIPFYAFFHPENPAQPVVLDGVFTSPQPFVDAIQKPETPPSEDVAVR